MLPYYFDLTKSQMWEDEKDEKQEKQNIKELSKNFFKEFEQKEKQIPGKIDKNLIESLFKK